MSHLRAGLVLVAACHTSPLTSDAFQMPDAIDTDSATARVSLVSTSSVSPNQMNVLAYADFETGTTCQSRVTVGSCVVYRNCETSVSALRRFSAGTISFDTSPVIELSPQGDRSYVVKTVDGAVLAPHQEVAIAATGGQIPAFGVSLSSPSEVTITSRFDLSTPIDRSQDLSMTWTGGDSGSVEATWSSGVDTLTGFDCLFDATAGGGAIPKAVLAMLDPEGLLSFSATTTTTQQVDVWPVRLDVSFSAVWADGSLAHATVAFVQ